MNRSTLKLYTLAVALLIFSAVPTLAQQVKGDSEVGLSGSFTIIPTTVGSTTTYNDTGIVSVDYGYYFTRHDLLGIADSVSISGTTGGTSTLSTDDTLYFRYRHLFGGQSAKVYPFAGAGGGFYSQSAPQTTQTSTQIITTTKTTTNGIYDLEGGMKFYMNPKTAFEVAYTYEAYSQSSGTTSSSSTMQSIDVISFGFTYVFGGPRSKH